MGGGSESTMEVTETVLEVKETKVGRGIYHEKCFVPGNSN